MMKTIACCLLVIVAVNAQIYGLKNTQVQLVTTGAAHYVEWAPNTVPISGNGIAGFEFEFYAEADNDIHVIFSCAKEQRPHEAIEVVLGSWGGGSWGGVAAGVGGPNRRSVIRRGAQGQDLVEADYPAGVCSANAARRYNVRYVNGEMFVYYFPDAPHKVSMRANVGGLSCVNAFVGLGGWDRRVKFLSSQVSVIAQGNSAHYGIFPLSVDASEFEFEFEFKGSNDVHVSLQCGQADRTKNAVEVLLGGRGGHRSVIRSGTQGSGGVAVRSTGWQPGVCSPFCVCDPDNYRNMKLRVEDHRITVFVNGVKWLSGYMPKLDCPSNQFQLGIAGWDSPVSFRHVARPVVIAYRTVYECDAVASSKDFWYYSNLNGHPVGLFRNQPARSGKDFVTAPAGEATCGGMVRTNGVLSHVTRNSRGQYHRSTDGKKWESTPYLKGLVDKCFVQLKSCPSGEIKAPKYIDEVEVEEDHEAN